MKIALNAIRNKRWIKIANVCLSGFIIAWAFVAGAQAEISIIRHNIIWSIVMAAITSFLFVATIWRDYWIQKLKDNLYENRYLLHETIKRLVEEIVILRHIAHCAVAIETEVEQDIKPNIEALKQFLDTYAAMRPRENSKPN